MQHKLPFPCAPVARTIVHTKAKFASFLVGTFPPLLSADGHEGPIWMKDDEVAFKVADEIELHFRELGIIRGEVLDA